MSRYANVTPAELSQVTVVITRCPTRRARGIPTRQSVQTRYRSHAMRVHPTVPSRTISIACRTIAKAILVKRTASTAEITRQFAAHFSIPFINVRLPHDHDPVDLIGFLPIESAVACVNAL